ncbi:MAG: periplasmic heavy metal sensor [Bacteroidetes bacterium]|nr:periplasmic heavy metal sensor [Bacteroidota bacterium]
MKTGMKRRAMLLTVVFSLLTIGIFAQQPPPPPPSPPPPAQPGMEPTDELLPPVLLLPDMTPDQQALIKKSDLKQMEAMTPLKNQMREKMARLNTALTTQPANVKEANALAEDIGQIHASILKLQISHDQELRNLLTNDQKVIFDSRPKPFLRRGK